MEDMYLLGSSKGLSRNITQTEWTEPPLEVWVQITMEDLDML